MKVWADPWSAGALSDASMFQPITIADDMVLAAVRTSVVVIGNPVFTSLCMKLYSNETVGGLATPRKLLATSTDVRTKAEVHTLPHGVKEVYFTFGNLPLKGGDTYNLVVNGTGYAPVADSSLLAWRKAWPDPVYRGGFTPTLINVNAAPYELYLIGARL
jgi:hypothetical protein